MAKKQAELPAAGAGGMTPIQSSNGQPAGGPPTTALNEFGGQSQRIGTSLNLGDKSGRQRMVAAMNQCDHRLVECVNQPIRVVDFLVHDVELKGKVEGETKPAVRMVLWDADGLTYECVATTLLRSFQRIAFAWGSPPWPEPKTLIPRTKKKGEFSIYWFDVQE